MINNNMINNNMINATIIYPSYKEKLTEINKIFVHKYTNLNLIYNHRSEAENLRRIVNYYMKLWKIDEKHNPILGYDDDYCRKNDCGGTFVYGSKYSKSKIFLNKNNYAIYYVIRHELEHFNDWYFNEEKFKMEVLNLKNVHFLKYDTIENFDNKCLEGKVE